MEKLAPEAGKAQEDRFADYARTRDAATRDELISTNLGLAHQLARRFANRGEPHDDLVQVASLALVKAVDRFDPDHGATFSSFAVTSIVGELKRHFRDKAGRCVLHGESRSSTWSSVITSTSCPGTWARTYRRRARRGFQHDRGCRAGSA